MPFAHLEPPPAPSSLSPLLQRHAVVIHAARCGTLEVLRPDAVAQCVRELCGEVERLALRVLADDRVANDRDEWVRIAVLAEARGFANADSFRRWCRRRKVPLQRVGKVLFARSADIDRVIEAPAQSRAAGEAGVEAVRNAVAQLTGAGR
jgi:hypothetical protein